MFNLQGSEIVIVLLLALVVLGPEKLPDAMRKLGEFYAELKKMSSGFQSEFRAAIDEPMREVQDTANVLRDSADLTKLQNGEREEKPKSAEMGPVADVETVEPDEVADFDHPTDGGADEPGLAADSKPSPFSGQSSAAPRPTPATPAAASLPGEAAGADAAASTASPEAGSDAPGQSTDSKPAPFAGQSSTAPRPAASPDQAEPVTDAADSSDAASAADDGPGAAEQSRGADDATGHAR